MEGSCLVSPALDRIGNCGNLDALPLPLTGDYAGLCITAPANRSGDNPRMKGDYT
jgi:hypothetical protein